MVFLPKSSKKSKTKKPRRAKTSEKNIARVIDKVLARQEETKHIEEQLWPNLATPTTNYFVPFPGQATIVGASTGSTVGTQLNLNVALCPNLVQGTGSQQRVGNKITDVRHESIFTFFFNTDEANYDAVIHLWCFEVKAAGNFTTLQAFPGRQFLLVGDGTSDDVDILKGSVNPVVQLHGQVAHMTPNKAIYKNIKHYTFRMRKGTGKMNSQPVGIVNVAPTGVMASESYHVIRHKHKTPANLIYGQNTDQQPDNYCPVWMAYSVPTDNDVSYRQPALLLSVRSELSFKDA